MIKTLYKVTITHINEDKEVTEKEMRSVQSFYQTRGWISNTMQSLTSGEKIDIQVELQQK